MCQKYSRILIFFKVLEHCSKIFEKGPKKFLRGTDILIKNFRIFGFFRISKPCQEISSDGHEF